MHVECRKDCVNFWWCFSVRYFDMCMYNFEKLKFKVQSVFLQALLSSYLLENCDMLSKHCLVLYLLLDLVSVDSSEENETVSIWLNIMIASISWDEDYNQVRGSVKEWGDQWRRRWTMKGSMKELGDQWRSKGISEEERGSMNDWELSMKE